VLLPTVVHGAAGGVLALAPQARFAQAAFARGFDPSTARESTTALLHREREMATREPQLRFGFDGHPRTLKKEGREFGATRERIQRIGSRTLWKLRQPSPAQRLRGDRAGCRPRDPAWPPPGTRSCCALSGLTGSAEIEHHLSLYRRSWPERQKAEARVATVMVFHEVEDVDHWLGSPRREEVFGPLGVTARTFVDPEKTNRTGLILEVPDMDVLGQFMESEVAADAMKFDGVRPETIVMLVEP
jgi:hypothetical protein